MRVFGLEWQFEYVAKQLPLDLSPRARDRLRALPLWKSTGNGALVAHTFQISRATLYRWREAFDPAEPGSLQERSRRPHRVRTPQWPARLVSAVRRLREQYPRWGRAKLTVLWRREGLVTSASTVGRILRDLRRRGRLHEPPRRAIVELLGVGALGTLDGPVELGTLGRQHEELDARALTRAFEVHDVAWTLPALNRQVRTWERVYNTIRPHQSLGQQTPLQFLQARGILAAAPPPSHMS